MVFDKHGKMLKPLVKSPEESRKYFTTVNEMFGVISEQVIAQTKDGSVLLDNKIDMFEILTGNAIQSTSLFNAYQN